MSVLTDGNPKSCRLYKPWLDEDDGSNVLFQSVHLHGNNFYPGTGHRIEYEDD